jgi:glycosyltransferase involved in cell wall biosynthesis
MRPVEEVIPFLDSLEHQTYRRFRLIVVDGNPDDRLDATLARYRQAFSLVHDRIPGGLSAARNAVLSRLEADVVGFPDDDCWYAPAFLERVTTVMGNRHLAGVTGCTIDARGRRSQLRWDTEAGPITRWNVLRRGLSPTIFLRRDTIVAVGPFDETLGPREGWRGSGEETDYLLRCLTTGYVLEYDPSLCVYHPSYTPRFGDLPVMRRAYCYGVDHSRMLRRHRYPLIYVAWRCLELAMGALSFLAAGRPGTTRFYLSMARGRLVGLVAPGRP